MKPDTVKESRFAWTEIDLKALAHNIKLIRSLRAGPGTKVMAVVKADAYGHGAVEVSKAALDNGAEALGVALAEEGILLRDKGIDAPIYILGECPRTAAEYAIENRLVLTVNSIDSARIYSAIGKKKGLKASININIDTGMNRLGINWKNIQDVSLIKSLDGLSVDGIFSHFSCADGEDLEYTKLQMKRFAAVLEKLSSSGIKSNNIHFANSAAFFRFQDSHFDMVRTGIAIYGLNPYNSGWDKWLPENVKKSVRGLKPVLTLKSRISFIKITGMGEPISYCGTFRTGRESVIATVPIGYADGYSRSLSNRAHVLIKGMEAFVVGNITMDQFMIDITDISKKKDIRPGDEVILIGRSGAKQISAEDMAESLGTINYEVACMIRNRIPRIYNK